MNTNFSIALSVNHPDDVTVYGAVHTAVKAERGGTLSLSAVEFGDTEIEDVIDQINQACEQAVEQLRVGLRARALQINAATAQKRADAEAKAAARASL